MSSQAIAKANVVSDKGTLEGLLATEKFQSALQTVLPKHLTPERMVKMALVAASRQPTLLKCTRESLLQAIMKSAELGLDCSGTLGRAYLVPYYNSKIGAYEAQFIAGYQGLIELARRSGNIARIESRVVYSNDQFTVEYGLDQKLIHRPALNTADRGAMTCVYAVAELTDGSRQIEVMTIAEINSIRDRSKAKDSGPWKTDYPEMARKTVIRRIAKYLPLSTELQAAFEADDALYNGHSDALAMAEKTRATAAELRERMDAIEAQDASETADGELSSVEDEVPQEPDPDNVDQTPPADEEESTPDDETEAKPVSKAEGQRLDLIAAIKDVERDDPERAAVALEGYGPVDNLTLSQAKDVHKALTS